MSTSSPRNTDKSFYSKNDKIDKKLPELLKPPTAIKPETSVSNLKSK